MSIPVEIIGTDHNGHKLHATMHHKGDTTPGLITYTESLREYDTLFAPLINDDYGQALNQAVSFGGAPEVVHVGTGDGTHWTGTNEVGNMGDFNSGARANSGTVSIKISNPVSGETIQFDKGSDVTVTAYTAITMFANIDRRWNNGDLLTLYCWDTGGAIQIGASISLGDYLDTGLNDVWQKATIPFSDLGLSTTDFDAIRIVGTRNGSNAMDVYLDDIQLEETGDAIQFRTHTPKRTKYLIDTLRFTLTDAYAGTVTDGTMKGLSYNQLLGVSKLANGILLQRIDKGKPTFSIPFRQLLDFTKIGFKVVEHYSDGTNTTIAIEQHFPHPLVVTGGDIGYLSLTISDDLTGLIDFTCACRGRVEVLSLIEHT